MEINPNGSVVIYTLVLVLIPLGILWALYYWSTSRKAIWRVLYISWILVNIVVTGILLSFAGFIMDFRRARADTWLLEEVVFAAMIVSLPLVYAILGFIGYYHRFLSNE